MGVTSLSEVLRDLRSEDNLVPILTLLHPLANDHLGLLVLVLLISPSLAPSRLKGQGTAALTLLAVSMKLPPALLLVSLLQRQHLASAH